jgi:CheY-like chemotaxis protein
MQTKQELIAKNFLQNVDALIVDSNNGSRKGLMRLLSNLGIPAHKIMISTNIDDALSIYKRKIPQLVLSDYYIMGGSGFELFQKIRELSKSKKKVSILTLLTSNATETIVAKAAEEDVDAYILKPYTIDTFTRILFKSINDFCNPSEYDQIITKGKGLLFDGLYSKAKEEFRRAVTKNQSPTLALFYQGQASYMMEKMQEAKDFYNQGLSFNKIHYKCLLGLYKLYFSSKNENDAYEVGRNIVTLFPTDAQKLCEVVHLSIKTKNYLDMISFHEVFTRLDDRDEKLRAYISSGLFVGGKYNLKNGQPELGIEQFESAVNASYKDPRVIRRIVEELYDLEEIQKAKDFFQKFNKEDFVTFEFQVASFLAENDEIDANEAIKEGLAIFKQEPLNERCFSILLKKMKELGMDERAKSLEEEVKKITSSNSLKKVA